MDLTIPFLITCFGLAMLWGIYWHQQFLAAQKGYHWYIRYSKVWKIKRWLCLRRFGNRCAVCNTPYRLEAHHRDYSNIYREKRGDLTCLCRDCHAKAPKSDGLYKG